MSRQRRHLTVLPIEYDFLRMQREQMTACITAKNNALRTHARASNALKSRSFMRAFQLYRIALRQAREALAHADRVWTTQHKEFKLSLEYVETMLDVWITFGYLQRGSTRKIKPALKSTLRRINNPKCAAGPVTRALILMHAVRFGYIPHSMGNLLLIQQYLAEGSRDRRAIRAWKFLAQEWSRIKVNGRRHRRALREIATLQASDE